MSRRRLLAVFGVALAVRVVYVLVLDPKIALVSDAFNYHALGDLIRHGHGYISPTEWLLRHQSRATAVFGPGHPGLLALGDLVGLGTVRQQQLFLGAVGSCTPVLTALLGWRVTRNQAVALAAGLIAAVDPLLFGSDGALMSETLFTLLGTAVVVLLVVRRQTPATSSARSAWTVVAAGALFGLAVLTRGDGVLLAPFVGVPLLWRRWREVALVMAVAAAVVMPWIVRNHVRFDRWVLSTNVGALVNGANCPESFSGAYLGSWSFDCAYRIELGGNEAVDASRLQQEGVRYARAHASRLPIVVAARVGRGWGVFQPFTQAHREARFEGRVRGSQSAGIVFTWALVPLALWGVWLLRRRQLTVVPIVGPLLLVTALFAISYGNSRFGELARPSLAVGAAAALVFGVEKLRQSRP